MNSDEIFLDIPRFSECPCCDAREWRVIWKNDKLQPIRDWKDFMYGGRKFIREIIHCNKCGFRYIQSPVSGNEYYVNADHSGYSSLAKARMRYFSDLKISLKKRGLIFQEYTSILDLGAGEGDWLASWPEVRDLSATETHPHLTRNMESRGIAVAPSIESFKSKRFDLITAFDFLEHMEDPGKLLQSIHDQLNDRGSIVIGVPDMGKLLARFFSTRYYLYCPMHYSYFTEDSLRSMIRKYFSKVEIFPAPTMHATLNGIAKWVFPKLQSAALDKLWFPFGYCASLIAIGWKTS